MASGDTLLALHPLGSEPPLTAGATLDTRNGHPVLDFDAATDEEAVWTELLPRHYGGGGLTVTIQFAATSATSGTVRWQVAFERLDPATDLDADSFTAFKSGGAAVSATSGQLTTVAIAFTAGAEIDSWAVGEWGRVKVRRDADATTGIDDATGDAELLGVEIRET
jgi:hypothetical protein